MPGAEAMAATRAVQQRKSGYLLVPSPSCGKTVPGHLYCRPCFSLLRSGGPLAPCRRSRGSCGLTPLLNTNGTDGRGPGIGATESLGGQRDLATTTTAAGATKAQTWTSTEVADAAQRAATSIMLVAVEDAAQRAATSKMLVAGSREGRGRSASDDGDAYAAGTAAAKTAAACNEDKAAGAALTGKLVSAAQGNKATAAVPMGGTKETAATPVIGPLKTTAANASAGRPATVKAQGAPSSGVAVSNAPAARRSAAGFERHGRSKMNISGPTRACVFGSVVLLHMLLFADQLIPLFSFFQAVRRQDEAPVPSWLRCCLHSNSCNSRSNTSSSSGRCFCGSRKPSIPQDCIDGTLGGSSSNEDETSFRRWFYPSICSDEIESYFRSSTRCSCTCDSSGTNVCAGFSNSDRTSSKGNSRCVGTTSCISNRLKGSVHGSGRGTRGHLQLVKPCSCDSHTEAFNTSRSSRRTVCGSKVGRTSSISLLDRHLPSVSSSYAYSSACVFSLKDRSAAFGGPWLLFAVADVGPDVTSRSEGAASEHTAPSCMKDCVCPSSSPADNRLGAAVDFAGGSETQQGGEPTAQLTQQQHVEEVQLLAQQRVDELQLLAEQHVEELQLSAQEHTGRLQLPPQQQVEELQLPPRQDTEELQLPAQEHEGKSDEAQHRVEQQEQQLEGGQMEGEEEDQVGRREHETDATASQQLRQQEHPVRDRQDGVVSDLQDLGAPAPVADQGQEEEQQHNENVGEQHALGGEQMRQLDDVQNAEGAYLKRQQAVSAAVSGLFPVGRHYDFMPLTKRLSTAKRLNLLEESECYEEYFSGDVTEAADAERSRSGSAGSVPGGAGVARTAARSPQDTAEDSLGTGKGLATGAKEERKTEGDAEGGVQEVAAAEEGAGRAAAPEAEGGTELGVKGFLKEVQWERSSLDSPAAADAGSVVEAAERRESLCLEDVEEASCRTGAAGTVGRVDVAQTERNGKPEAGAAAEEPPFNEDTEARGELHNPFSSPLSAAARDYEQEEGSKPDTPARPAGNEERTETTASHQREQLHVFEWGGVGPDDTGKALHADGSAASAAAGNTSQRPPAVYRTGTNTELPQGAEEETLSSDGEEEEGDEGEDDDEDEEDLTSRLLIRRRPLVTLDLTSAGFEDIPAAEPSPRGAPGSSSSAAVDAFSAPRPPSHPTGATPGTHAATTAATYSYSGVTVGSPLPSSYATLPLLLSAYNAAIPPGVLPGVAVPSAARNSPPAGAFLPPTRPPSPVSPRPPFSPVQPRAAAPGGAESHFDDSVSRGVGLFGSNNTSPAFKPDPSALPGSPAAAASASPSPPRTSARPTSAPTPQDTAGAPHRSRVSAGVSSAPPGSTAAHLTDAEVSQTTFRPGAAVPASMREASRSRVAASPSPHATGAGSSRPPSHAGAAVADSASSAAAATAASAAGRAASFSSAAVVSPSSPSAKAAGPQADESWAAAIASSAEYYPADGYPAAPSSPATHSLRAASPFDAAYFRAEPNPPATIAADGSDVAPHAAKPGSADQNSAASGNGVGGLETLTPHDVGCTGGSAGALQEHAATEKDTAAISGISHTASQYAARASSLHDAAAAFPESTAGSSSTGGDTAILAATMAAGAAAQIRTSAAAPTHRLDSATIADRYTSAAKAEAALADGTEGSEEHSSAATANSLTAVQSSENSSLQPGEQTPRRLYEGTEQQKFNTLDPRLALHSGTTAQADAAAAVEKERSGDVVAEARVETRGKAAAPEAHQRQRVVRRQSTTPPAAHRRGGNEGGGGTPAAAASGAAALMEDTLQEPSTAAGTSSTTAHHASPPGGRGVVLALRKSGAAPAGAGAEGEGAAVAGGAAEALAVRAAPTGGGNIAFSRHGGAKEGGADLPDFGRDVYHPDAASEATTLSSTGATSSLAEASFKKPSDALKNLVARQDAGEWQHERDAFERHYPFKKPLLIRSTTTGRVFEIAFDSVLGAGGQGVVFAATILSNGTGVALKIFRIRPDQRRDEGREEGMLRRRVQSELNVWDFIPGGLSPREWSEFAHLVIPLDVVQPLKIHKSPPRHEVRYASQWIMMDLFAGDVARMPRIMSASASVKMEVTEQMFLSNMRLHDMGLVHSDIKLPNFFIGMDGRIFLGDHSLATPIGENVPCMSGTVRYLPPENMKCINDGRRRIMTTERKDVWALGIVLYKLWCGQQYPYEIGELWSRDLFVRAARAHVDELDLTGCDKMATVPILGLLRIMLTPQVSKRPTLREIHKFHPLFAPQKNTHLRSRTLHSLLEEIQSGRGNFEAGKFTGGSPIRHALFGGVDLKR